VTDDPEVTGEKPGLIGSETLQGVALMFKARWNFSFGEAASGGQHCSKGWLITSYSRRCISVQSGIQSPNRRLKPVFYRSLNTR
jgi:hypothetical protein